MFNLQTHGNSYWPGGQGKQLPVQPRALFFYGRRCADPTLRDQVTNQRLFAHCTIHRDRCKLHFRFALKSLQRSTVLIEKQTDCG